MPKRKLMKLPKPKINNRTKQVLIILFVIGVLLCIPPFVKAVVNAVGGALNWSQEKIQAVTEGAPVLGKALLVGLVAYAVLGTGIALVASPVIAVAVVGAVLAVAAVAALVWVAYSVGKVFDWWGRDEEEEELPPGQKPDNVSLGGLM
jgi:hypothetical protein